MSTLKLLISIFLLTSIASCSQFEAFEDRRREPSKEHIWVGSSKPGKPAICYNPLFYSKEKIQAKADDICRSYKENSHAEFVDVEYFSCRLLIPAKAHYQCVVDK